MLRRILGAAAVVALLVYAATGAYFVPADGRGVVRVLGRVSTGSSAVPPGMHVTLPRPFARVDIPRTQEVRSVHVGLTPEDRAAIAQARLARCLLRLGRKWGDEDAEGDVRLTQQFSQGDLGEFRASVFRATVDGRVNLAE